MFKLKNPSKLLISIFLLLLLLSAGGVLVIAGQSDNAEGGEETPLNTTSSNNHIEVEAAQQVENLHTNGEGQPDTAVPTTITDEIERQAKPEAPLAQNFHRIAGSNFQPRNSTTAYSYLGGGCVQRNSSTGDSWFTIDLSLPDGAVIDFLRVYFYDMDATYDIESELWAFDGAGGTTLIAEADSSGALGYSSAGSNFFSHTVDNLNESLVIVAAIQGGVGSNLALCGVRVRYQYSVLATNFLPTIMNEADVP